MEKKIIVAIDGYSACGKSTLAKALAEATNFLYVDSGAMYRAVTLYFTDNQVNLENVDAVRQALDNIYIDLDFENDNTFVLLNGIDVSGKIREMNISRRVPLVSSIKSVRDKLISVQREYAKNRNIIMDGRDIGTVVFPNANLKIFMTADVNIRASRRHKELMLKYPEITHKEVLESLYHRDQKDINRKISPLTQAADAYILDNSRMSREKQLNIILDKIKVIIGSQK